MNMWERMTDEKKREDVAYLKLVDLVFEFGTFRGFFLYLVTSELNLLQSMLDPNLSASFLTSYVQKSEREEERRE